MVVSKDGPTMQATLFGKFLLFLIIHNAACSFVPPSFGGGEESGISLSDVTQRKSGAEYVALDKGRASKAANQGFDKDERGAHGQSQNGGHYSDQDNNQKGYDVGRHSLGQAQSFNQGDNEFQQHGSGQQKKGFHKSGFTNNYHKDESGNKASFYEDSDDERAHRGYDNRGGFYGQKAEDGFRDGRHDTAFNGRNRGNQGLYDNSAGFDNRRGHSGGYNDNRYLNDRRNYLQDGAGRVYDRNGNEAYYRREQPYHNQGHYPAAPLVSGPLYSRDYLDAPPPRYIIDHEEPYRGGKRFGYFPNRRPYHETELIYPEKSITYDDAYIGGGGGLRRGGGYGGGGGGGGGYSGGYGGYKKGYQPLEVRDGYRRSY